MSCKISNIETNKRSLSFKESEKSKKQITFDETTEAVPYDLENDPDNSLSSIEHESKIDTDLFLTNYQTDIAEQPVMTARSEQSEMATRADQSDFEMRVAPGFEIEVINAEQPRISSRFRRDEYNFDFGITHNLHHLLPNLLEASNEISNLYEDMVLPILKKYPSDHKYCVFIKHRDLKNKPIYIAGSAISEFDSSEFLTSIYRVSQSNEDFLLTGEIKVTITVKKPVLGNGRNKYHGAPRDAQKRRLSKKSVISINNESDNLCGYRAIYVGVMWHILDIKNGVKDQYEWKKVKGVTSCKKPWTVNVQKEGALQICREALLPLDQPLTVSRMRILQENYLTPRDYQLLVIDANDPTNYIFKGPRKENQICLEFTDNHYNTITEMNKYLETTNYCAACNTGFSTSHKCKVKCQLCGSEPKCELIQLINCEICLRTFNSQTCFEAHKSSYCLNVKKCPSCEVEYNEIGIKHKCDHCCCKKCGETYEISPHYCYLKTLELAKLEKEDKVLKIIVCYDIESIQVRLEENKYQHKAYLLIAEIVCDKCWNVSEKRKLSDCVYCGPFYKEFIGLDCVKQFGDYVYKDLAKRAAKEKAKVLVFAHNSSGYDGHFVYTDLFKRDFEDTHIIMKGLKILKIDVANVRFLDSLSFFQQPLSQLPKSFGISDQVIKGFFPHLFSKMENLKHIGSLPPIEDYGIKYMKKSTADDLRKWYDKMSQNHAYIFNYENELKKYCANDVKILTMSIMLYRQLFKNATKLDPCTRNFTLASVGFEYFRAVILKEHTIGICPLKTYSSQRNQSKSANCYLDYLQEQREDIILREQRKGNYFVDGYIPEDNKVIEFFGCRWHGCPKCYKVNRDIRLKELNNLSYNEAHKNSLDKLEYFQRRNIDVHSLWECDYKIMRKESPQLSLYHKTRINYYDDIEIYGAADIRESFFGGRTNNLYFTYDCTEFEKIGYVDFTSLYPYVLVSNNYPVGHPKVISQFKSSDISSYFGFIKCIILPPYNLYLGVLPSRINKKLYFPLCRTCAEINSNDTCEHSEDERCLIGTWTSIEAQKAVEKGYVIMKIIQVLHYEQKSDQIFQPYIRTWLKIKTESSGWPKTCTTQESKEKFINDFERREGVKLDPNNMIKNEGMRYIAKLKLNTLWGKLGQNPNQMQTIICNDYYDYAKIENDPSIVIKGEFMPTDNKLIVSYKYNDTIFDRPGNTSPAIASFVTAYARLKLYSELDKLETSVPGSVLYFDTDSIFYVYRTDIQQYTPTTGDFLGDLTDEIWKDYETEGAYISSFASSGPKNYGYKVRFPNGSSKSKCKIKGITLTDEVEKDLNFDVIYNFARDFTNGEKTRKEVPQQQFRADQHHNVYTTIFDKAYRVVSEKRRLVGNRTFPYGYVE